jgi:hypothetical protein
VPLVVECAMEASDEGEDFVAEHTQSGLGVGGGVERNAPS